MWRAFRGQTARMSNPIVVHENENTWTDFIYSFQVAERAHIIVVMFMYKR